MNKILKYIIYIIFGILLYICLNNIEKLDIKYRLQEGVTNIHCLSSNNMSAKCIEYDIDQRNEWPMPGRTRFIYNIEPSILNADSTNLPLSILDQVDEMEMRLRSQRPRVKHEIEAGLKKALLDLLSKYLREPIETINCDTGNFLRVPSSKYFRGTDIVNGPSASKYSINIYSKFVCISPDLDNAFLSTSNPLRLLLNCIAFNPISTISISIKDLFTRDNMTKLMKWITFKFNRMRALYLGVGTNEFIIPHTARDVPESLYLSDYTPVLNIDPTNLFLSDQLFLGIATNRFFNSEYPEELEYTDLDGLLKVYCIAHRKYQDWKLSTRESFGSFSNSSYQYYPDYIPKKPIIYLKTHASLDESEPLFPTEVVPTNLGGRVKITKTSNFGNVGNVTYSMSRLSTDSPPDHQSTKFPLSFREEEWEDPMYDSNIELATNGTYYALIIENDNSETGGYRQLGTYKDIKPYETDIDLDYICEVPINTQKYIRNKEYMASIGQLTSLELPLLLISPTKINPSIEDIIPNRLVESGLSVPSFNLKLSLVYQSLQRRIHYINQRYQFGNDWNSWDKVPLDLFSAGCHKFKKPTPLPTPAGDVELDVRDKSSDTSSNTSYDEMGSATSNSDTESNSSSTSTLDMLRECCSDDSTNFKFGSCNEEKEIIIKFKDKEIPYELFNPRNVSNEINDKINKEIVKHGLLPTGYPPNEIFENEKDYCVSSPINNSIDIINESSSPIRSSNVSIIKYKCPLVTSSTI